jgi:hypothetical protein
MFVLGVQAGGRDALNLGDRIYRRKGQASCLAELTSKEIRMAEIVPVLELAAQEIRG